MNYRKVNWCFLGMIMLHLGVVGLLLALRNVYSMGMVTNLLVSELILAVPAFLAVLTSREKPNRVLGFHKLKVSSVFMIDRGYICRVWNKAVPEPELCGIDRIGRAGQRRSAG